MKTTLFSTVSAIALTGLCVTLTPSTLSAHDGGRGAHHATGKSCSRGSSNRGNRGGHGRTCRSLPHGCHASNYHGRRCWYGNGHYYGVCADGGYEILDDQSDIDTTIVDTTVVDQTVVADDTDDVTVSVLPADAEVTYVGGEQCWYSNGCYYHRSGHGFCKSRCRDKGGRVCKNKGSGTHTVLPGTDTPGRSRCKSPRDKGHSTSRSCSHSSHSTGHSGGHGRR
jgi:hypothetical protein